MQSILRVMWAWTFHASIGFPKDLDIPSASMVSETQFSQETQMLPDPAIRLRIYR
jgi:hypothetical protein